MKAAKIMVKGTDGHEYQYSLYAEEVAGDVVQGINESPAGEAGSVAHIAGLVDVETIEPAKADGYTTIFSNHRLPWRAIEHARRHGTYAYAVHGDRRVPLTIHRGALGGRTCYSEPRYMIEGREYVLCVDSHFEPAESRDANGRLVGWYDSVVADTQD